MRYLSRPRQASGLVRRGARVGSRGPPAPWHPGMPPRPLLEGALLSHTYPPKHPPHRSFSQQGLDSLQLEQPLLRHDLQVLSFGCIERLASAGTPWLSLSRIPSLSAHSHIWENIPFGARMPGILPMVSILFASSSDIVLENGLRAGVPYT